MDALLSSKSVCNYFLIKVNTIYALKTPLMNLMLKEEALKTMDFLPDCNDFELAFQYFVEAKATV